MKKFLVLSLIVLLASVVAFAGKLSFSGSVDVTPWIEFGLTPSSFQASGAAFGKCLSFSVTGVASSDYGYVGFSWGSTSPWAAYIQTPLVEATDVTLIMQGGRFSVYNYAASGGTIYADGWGGCTAAGDCQSDCDHLWYKNPTISDGESYDVANMLILDYKDALTIKTVLALCGDTLDATTTNDLCLDLDIYTSMLVLDPVYLYVHAHNLASSNPYLVLMGKLDAGKEAGFPLGFAGKLKVENLATAPALTAWEVGGWFDFSDPLSVYWKLSGTDIASSAFDGVVTVSGIEMLKGDWNFGIDFNFANGTFTLVDFGFTGSYSHVKDSEISYYPGILVTLPTGEQTTATVELWCKAEFTFELPSGE